MKFSDTKYGDMTGKKTVEFVNVNGEGLTSLEGSPKVGQSFSVTDNLLTDLQHAPEKLHSFDCSRNPNLKTLMGGPKSTTKYYECTDNPKLKNLKGVATKIGNNAIFEGCTNLTSLEGLKEVRETLYIGGCGFKTKEDIIYQILEYNIRIGYQVVWDGGAFYINDEFKKKQKVGKFRDFLDL